MVPAPIWAYMAKSGGGIARRVPTISRRAGPVPLYTTALRLFHASVTTPIRVVRTLYHLGHVLDQNPGILQYSRPFLGGHTSDNDHETVSIVESAGSGEQKSDFEVEAPATASQVYHAAILNSATLDNLLAVFEVSEDQSSLNQTPREEGDLRPKLDHTTYGNSSIQMTPDSAMTPRNSSKILREYVQDETLGIVERTYGHLVKAIATDSQHKQEAGSPDLLSNPAVSSCSQPGGNTTQSAVCENMSPEHVECPTFARRQAKSRLPQRAKSEAKERTATVVGAVSSNVNADGDSPSRRNKLQRRARVVG